MSTFPYISCIKINGAPILPPVMTEKRRAECQEYRQKAIELDRRIDRNKLFEKCMEDLMNLQSQTQGLVKTQQLPSTVKTLEQQLAFADDVTASTSSMSQKFQNLTSETIDVSEYSGRGVKVLSRTDSLDETIAEVPEIPKESPPLIKPKLIRSNSYTLESPSPILLAHLEKEAQKVAECNRRSSYIADEEETSPDNFRSLSPNTVICNEELNDVKTPQSYELIETDITVQQISVSTPIEPLKPLEASLLNSANIPDVDVDPQLLDILSKLPTESATKILEILNKQKKQQETHQQLKDKLLDDNSLANTGRSKPNSLSISSSQSLYYSLSSSSDTYTPDKVEEQSRIHNSSHEKRNSSTAINLRNAKNCSRKLFLDAKKEQEWAASVIGAAVRGYLVRRLLRTEKVQTLIQTIQDALLCAIQLHNADTIDESDIELHRRLIQQVSAACYAFHDVFFALSTKEQLSIISTDRQRRIEKSKRPLSSSSRISDGRGPTPRSNNIKPIRKNSTKV